jgi:glutamate carboxypeptidase
MQAILLAHDSGYPRRITLMACHIVCPRALCALFIAAAAVTGSALAAPVEPVWSLAQKEKPALLNTLRELVEIDSGSRDIEGLDRIANVIAARLKVLGGKVELVDPELEEQRGKIGKMVRATFMGKGTRKVLLLAHMDTVYPRGRLAGQPFKIEGDRVWGLGIADDRHGIAVILHALAILRATDFREYGVVTVLINGDEEIGSPGSRNLITKLGAEHDAVMSFEGGGGKVDNLRLATSGVARATITVRGRASHAGSAPELGVNALYEMAHQVLQARHLSDDKAGIKVNWTLANAGIVGNMIPPGAQASATVRVERVADHDVVEQKLRELVKNKLLPEAHVEVAFQRSFPPLEPTAASRALAAHAQLLYAEIGRKLAVNERATGGGTDAANAAVKTKAPVIEGFGLRGFGAHSTDSEYVLTDSIEPRLYLAARMIMDIATGKAPLAGTP